MEQILTTLYAKVLRDYLAWLIKESHMSLVVEAIVMYLVSRSQKEKRIEGIPHLYKEPCPYKQSNL